MSPVTEPPNKRVRFDPSLPSPQASSGGLALSKLDGNDVVQLRFVQIPADLHEDGARGPHPRELSSRPTFTHQIFPNGIVGIQSATAALYFTCASLHCWVDCYVCPLDEKSGLLGMKAKAIDSAYPDESSHSAGHSEADQTDTEESITKTLGRFILAGRVNTREELVTAAEADSQFLPPVVSVVEPVLTYTAPGKNGPHTFSVFRSQLSSSREIRDYHKRMQLLMFLHIDGANFIDDSDPRWELFVVLQHIGGIPRYLVGYATVYPFSAMRPGTSLDVGFAERIRISQVFVLPRYQRGGHGGKLLTAIYKESLRRDAFEVTVEDPSEGFRLLRDMTDLPRAYEAAILDPKCAPEPEEHAAVLAALRDKLLLTKAQARRCLEVHCLRLVDRKDADAYRKYRLWVKRRLHEEYLEVLEAFSPGADRKAKLAEIYNDYEREYLCVVNRMHQKKC